MRDACTAAALQDKSCDAPSRTLCLYDESFASKSKLIDKTSALQSLDAIIGSAPSCPTATRRSARRSQTVDSLRRALAAVADFFRARAARLQAAGLKRAGVHLSAVLPACRRYAVAETLKRSSTRARRRYAGAATPKPRRRPWATSGPRKSAASCRPARGRGPRTRPSRRRGSDPSRIDLEPSRPGRRRRRDRPRRQHHRTEEHRWT